MKYTVTSAEASKMLKKILEEKNIILANERQSSVFNKRFFRPSLF